MNWCWRCSLKLLHQLRIFDKANNKTRLSKALYSTFNPHPSSEERHSTTLSNFRTISYKFWRLISITSKWMIMYFLPHFTLMWSVSIIRVKNKNIVSNSLESVFYGLHHCLNPVSHRYRYQLLWLCTVNIENKRLRFKVVKIAENHQNLHVNFYTTNNIENKNVCLREVWTIILLQRVIFPSLRL